MIGRVPIWPPWRGRGVWIAGALALAVTLLLVSFGSARAAETETIVGKVVNGTKGATPPSGLPVTLQGVGQGHALITNQTVIAGPDGQFRFTGIPADPSATYVVTTQYAGVPYLSEVPKAAGSPPSATVELTIYEPTTSDAAIRIESESWLLGSVDVEKQQATILALLTVINDGDRTFVGDHRGDPGAAVPGILPRTLHLSLPRGAAGFQPEMGLDPGRLLPVANGYVATDPIRPGKQDVGYTFQIGYAEGIAELQTDLLYPTTRLRFLAPDVGLEFRSDHLGDGGTVQIQGQTFRVLAADNLPANSTVTIDVVGLPAVGTSRLSPGAMQVGGISLIILGLAAAIYLGVRSRGTRQAQVLAERNALLAALAQLDDEYAAGRLELERYQAERAHQKRQLVDLLLSGRGVATGSGTP